VLVGFEGQVKLADFGIAKTIADAPSGSEVKGTAGYIAPEVLVG
jgi:serine/threonine protein kinase